MSDHDEQDEFDTMEERSDGNDDLEKVLDDARKTRDARAANAHRSMPRPATRKFQIADADHLDGGDAVDESMSAARRRRDSRAAAAHLTQVPKPSGHVPPATLRNIPPELATARAAANKAKAEADALEEKIRAEERQKRAESYRAKTQTDDAANAARLADVREKLANATLAERIAILTSLETVHVEGYPATGFIGGELAAWLDEERAEARRLAAIERRPALLAEAFGQRDAYLARNKPRRMLSRRTTSPEDVVLLNVGHGLRTLRTNEAEIYFGPVLTMIAPEEWAKLRPIHDEHVSASDEQRKRQGIPALGPIVVELVGDERWNLFAIANRAGAEGNLLPFTQGIDCTRWLARAFERAGNHEAVVGRPIAERLMRLGVGIDSELRWWRENEKPETGGAA